MKPPNHPVPSGDRTFARLIVAALAAAGHEVRLLTPLVTWQAAPDGLERLLAQAEQAVETVLARCRLDGAPDAILTYHNYHKAPDLVGPRVAEAIGVPYAIVEASRAPRRARGPWARHFALADAALVRADAVGAVTRHDLLALAAHLPERVVLLPPFVDVAPFVGAAAARAPEAAPGVRLVCAAMMRPGRKADSLRVLAAAVARVREAEPAARLAVAGDGAARAALEPLFAPGTFLGRLEVPALAALFLRSDVFVWPAVDEPFGFAFLEAQAAGLPVVGGAARGVVDVVRDGRTGILVPPGEVAPLAEAVLALARDPTRRMAMGAAARAHACANDLAAGARRLDALLARAAAWRAGAGGAVAAAAAR